MQQNALAATHTSVGFDILATSECLSFLRSEHVGRLGLTSGALPVVVPILYRLVGHSVVFATEAGAKLNSARRNAVACVEIDGSDPSTEKCWTVLATGRLREIADPTATSFDGGLPLLAWGLPTAEYFVALDIELLSGTTSTAP